MSQIIYILTNPHMPQLALIGYFDVGTLEKEMQRLYSEGVPDFFECEYAAEVEDAEKIEGEVRQKIASDFVSHERGFFKKESIAKIKTIIQKQQIKDLTPNSQIDENNRDNEEAASRGEAFDFHELGIKKGEVLTFIKDESIVCSVYDNKKVRLGTHVRFFSEATKLSYKEIDKLIPSKSYRGNNHWNYKGKKLLDIWEDHMRGKGK